MRPGVLHLIFISFIQAHGRGRFDRGFFHALKWNQKGGNAMSVLKIPMLLLKLPMLVFLSFLQAILSILDRLSGFCTGLLTLVLAGFWIHHCILGNRDNLILLSISLAVCMGIPILLQTTGFLLRVLAKKI